MPHELPHPTNYNTPPAIVSHQLQYPTSYCVPPATMPHQLPRPTSYHASPATASHQLPCLTSYCVPPATMPHHQTDLQLEHCSGNYVLLQLLNKALNQGVVVFYQDRHQVSFPLSASSKSSRLSDLSCIDEKLVVKLLIHGTPKMNESRSWVVDHCFFLNNLPSFLTSDLSCLEIYGF